MKVRQGASVDPTRITQTIPNINTLRPDLVNIAKLYPYSDLKKAKDDKRSKLEHWETEDEIPSCIKTLVDLCKEEAEGAIGYRVYYGSFMRKSMMRLPPPTADTLSRFLFNINEKEKYIFDSDVPALDNLPSFSDMVEKKAGCRIPARDLFMEADQMLQLGPATTTNYKVYVHYDPKIERPQTINPSNMSSNKKSYTLRTARYHRITVIVDLLGAEEQVIAASRRAEEAVERLTAADIQHMTASLKNPNVKNNEDKLSKKEQNDLQNIMREVQSDK